MSGKIRLELRCLRELLKFLEVDGIFINAVSM